MKRNLLRITLFFSLMTFLSACSLLSQTQRSGDFIQSGDYAKKTKTNKKVIVFVHGVMGDKVSTWTNNFTAAYWPNLIGGDPELSDFDVFVSSFYTPVIASALDLEELSVSQLNQLKLRDIFDYDQVYFISHSMGGLITKRMLTKLNTPINVNKLRKVTGVLLFSTPSKGAEIASIATWISANPQFKDMKPYEVNTFLKAVENDWIQLIAERNDLKVFTPRAFVAYETKSMSGVLVVPGFYAQTQCDAQPYPFDANHSQIVKPASREADQYVWAKGTIKQWAASVETQAQAPEQSELDITKSNIGNKTTTFVTNLTVWSEVDASIYVDDNKIINIDHSSGFDYSGTKIRVNPKSMMTVKAKRITKTISLWSLCNEKHEECKVRVGTQRFSDIQLSEEEKRVAMGDPSEAAKLLKQLSVDINYNARAWAAQRLGYIGGKATVNGLVAALQDSDPWVQANAAEALGRISDPSALPSLEKAFAGYNHKDSYGYIFESAIKNLKFAATLKEH